MINSRVLPPGDPEAGCAHAPSSVGGRQSGSCAQFARSMSGCRSRSLQGKVETLWEVDNDSAHIDAVPGERAHT